MKSKIKNLITLSVALGLMFNLIQINTYIGNKQKSNQEIRYLVEDEHAYPGGECIEIIL